MKIMVLKNIVISISILILFVCACGEPEQAEIVTKYPNGATQKLHYIKYVQNKKIVTKEVRLYPSGEKELEGEFNYDGQKHGKWTYWYSHGQKWLEEHYKNGRQDGKITEWYKSGALNYIGHFKNGLPHGDWIFYDGKGNKTSQITYENGEKVTE